MRIKTDRDYLYYEKIYPRRNLDKTQIINRFAPSPTGFIHIGSLYSALVNIWFSKQTKGVSFLRIEDTDQERIVENGIEGILSDLKELNISFDEDPEKGGVYSPYIQSERKDIYASYINKMLDSDLAYPCFCSEDDLSELRAYQEKNKLRLGYYGKYAKCRHLTKEEVDKRISNGENYIIRFKSQGSFYNKIILNDLIKSKIEMPENDLDIVILKKDLLPTYHFAHVIDDYLMGTTHVIRGDEWISSFPVHEELFRLLGFDLPKYAHVSPVNIKDGEVIRKISKRKDPWASVSYYNEAGIPHEVIFLYLATLLNSNFEEWYELNKDLGIKDFEFTFNKMSKSGPIFDMEKLLNISKTYFSRMNASDIYDNLLMFTKKYDEIFYNILTSSKEYTINLLNIERNIKKPRKDISKYSDVLDLFWYMYPEYFYENNDGYELIENIEKNWFINYFNDVYNSSDTQEVWWDKLSTYVKENLIISPADFTKALRVFITKKNLSPNLYDLIKLLGKEEMIKRTNLYFDK